MTKRPNTPRIGRRRYAEAIRLLKGVIANETQPIERRLRAVDKLLDVYDRNDRTYERRARQAAKAAEAVSETPKDEQPPVQDEHAEDAKVRALLADILNRKNDAAA